MKANHHIKIGDKYIQRGKFAVATVTGITETHVSWKVEDGNETRHGNVTVEEFQRLESIKIGRAHV